MEGSLKENKMATMPVNKLLLSMALPIMISMLVQALYNVVDSVFVAKYSASCMTAISLVFPIQTLMIAVGSGVGVGMNAILSRCLGARDKEGLDKTAVNGIIIYAISYLIFLLIGIFGVDAFMASQSNSPEIVKEGTIYLKIVCIFSFGMLAQFCFEKMLQATGRTIFSMYTQMLGAIINIILDPILIFGLFGAPRMGMAGAAIATVIGQIAAGMLALIFNIKINKEIDLKEALKFRPCKETIGKILYIGVPSIIMQSIGSIMVLGINTILGSMNIVGTGLSLEESRNIAIAVFGIYFKLQSFVFMPVFGLNNGMVPIVAFCLGAKEKSRLTKTIKLSFMYAFAILCLGTVVFQLIPDKLLYMFGNESNFEHLKLMGVPALRIISLSFPVASFCIISLSVFQALGNGIISMIVSFSRQLIVIVPVAYLLSLTEKIGLVWYAFLIAEVVSVTLCVIAFRYMYKKIIKPLGN